MAFNCGSETKLGGVTVPTVGLVKRRISAALRIGDADKPRVYLQMADAAHVRNLPYWLGIVFSSTIATLGLVLNSPAVIIGAMLISPLMAPIMTIGMAIAVGDMRLTLRAIGTLFLSVLGAVAFAAAVVKVLPFHATTPEILSRTNPTLLDLAVAVASGLAGSVATARSGSEDSSTALPGVAIAVALMPPLCTVGFGVGAGWTQSIIIGAGLLFLTNLVAIVASAFLVFLLVGLRTPEVVGQIAHTSTLSGNALGPLDRLLRHKVFGRDGAGSQLHLRAAVLVILLVAISLPLKRSLTQVVVETRDRSAVQEGLRQLASASDLVSQNVQLGEQSIDVALVTARNIPSNKINATEQWIADRVHKQVHLRVVEVASREELTEMMRRLTAAQTAAAAAASAPKPQPSLSETFSTGQEMMQKVLASAWPSSAPAVDSFDVSLSAEGTILTVHYTAKRDVSADAQAILQTTMQDATKLPDLKLVMVRTAPTGEKRAR